MPCSEASLAPMSDEQVQGDGPRNASDTLHMLNQYQLSSLSRSWTFPLPF